ncbi:MAG: hypothetical protein O7A71_08620 [Chloroflexi bacterium]|nr:hypothetical protein [Chloroflexota bacterium]
MAFSAALAQAEGATLGEGLAERDTGLLTTLVCLDTELWVDDAWQSLIDALGGGWLDEALAGGRVRLAVNAGERSVYREARVGGRRVALALTTVTGAVRAERIVVRAVRIGVGGVSASPLRARQTEAALRGRRIRPELVEAAVDTMRAEVRPAGAGDAIEEATVSAVDALLREALAAALPAGPISS